jgi:hypothetical protein
MMDTFTNTKTLLIVGGLVGATAVTAALADPEDEVTEDDFTGQFERTSTVEDGDVLQEQISIQEGSNSGLTGFYHATRSGQCQYEYTRDFSGRVDVNTAFLNLVSITYTATCPSGTVSGTLALETWPCKLRNDNEILRCTNSAGNEIDYQRQ